MRPIAALLPPAGLRGLLLFAVALALCGAMVGQLYRGGLERGMDHAIAWGPESEENAFAVALSDLVYHLNKGYVGYQAVKDRLVETIDPEGSAAPAVWPRLRDAALLNEALAKASSLGALTPGFIDDHSLFSMYYDDLGFVDYIKLAFLSFGERIQSLYALYFVLLGLSVAAFLLSFPFSTVALLVLIGAVFQFWAEIQGPLFDASMPTLYGMRHSSVLAIIPAWHLALLAFWRVRPTPRILAGAIIQALILLLAMTIRGSAQWTLLVLASLFVLLALRSFRRRGPLLLDAVRAAYDAIRWPFVLLLVVMAVHGAALQAALHPIYLSDDVLPRHGLWHSAYLGLQTSPEIRAITRATNTEDATAYGAALSYMIRRNYLRDDQSYHASATGLLRQGLHDKIMRQVYFEFVGKHPWLTLKVYLVEKPRALAARYLEILGRYPAPVWAAGGCLLAGLLLLLPFAPPIDRRERRGVLILLPLMVFWSGFPILIAYPVAHAMVDPMLVWTAALFVALLLGLSALARRISPVGRRPGAGVRERQALALPVGGQAGRRPPEE